MHGAVNPKPTMWFDVGACSNNISNKLLLEHYQHVFQQLMADSVTDDADDVLTIKLELDFTARRCNGDCCLEDEHVAAFQRLY